MFQRQKPELLGFAIGVLHVVCCGVLIAGPVLQKLVSLILDYGENSKQISQELVRFSRNIFLEILSALIITLIMLSTTRPCSVQQVIYYIWTPQIVVTIPENLEKLAKHRQV